MSNSRLEPTYEWDMNPSVFMDARWWNVTFVFDYTTISTVVEAYEDKAEEAARWFVCNDTLIPKEILNQANEVIIVEVEEKP